MELASRKKTKLSLPTYDLAGGVVVCPIREVQSKIGRQALGYVCGMQARKSSCPRTRWLLEHAAVHAG